MLDSSGAGRLNPNAVLPPSLGYGAHRGACVCINRTFDGDGGQSNTQ